MPVWKLRSRELGKGQRKEPVKSMWPRCQDTNLSPPTTGNLQSPIHIQDQPRRLRLSPLPENFPCPESFRSCLLNIFPLADTLRSNIDPIRHQIYEHDSQHTWDHRLIQMLIYQGAT